MIFDLNKKLLSLIIIGFILISACNNRIGTETEAWNDLLVSHHIQDAHEKFIVLIEEEPDVKKHYLGLAYTQCILDNSEWMSTLEKFSTEEEVLWSYGHLATVFKRHLRNPKIQTGLNIVEFRALHLGGKFKIDKNHQTIEGEYRNMKPFGTWKYYNLKGDFLREEKH
ncbi:MAG: hypothetical protein HRT69_13040 [Flavobacteriaceae bacterium]|nr:hypothetical protein [Flavobacteriaceae bacterium]